jgi:hypothetical protein
MASLLHAASKGHLQRQCATTPVFIGSPHLSRVDRHSKRAAGNRAFSAIERSRSAAAEFSGVGLPHLAPQSFNAKAICRGAAPEGAGMSQRLVRRSSTTLFSAGQQLPANPAVDPAPSGRWTLRDKTAQRRAPLR